jgi:hypothetical protein
VVLVKFELQTYMEHLSSCRSGFLVVFVLLNLLNLLTVALCYGSVYKMVSYLIGGVLYLVNLVPWSVIWDTQPLGPLLMVNG